MCSTCVCYAIACISAMLMFCYCMKCSCLFNWLLNTNEKHKSHNGLFFFSFINSHGEIYSLLVTHPSSCRRCGSTWSWLMTTVACWRIHLLYMFWSRSRFMRFTTQILSCTPTRTSLTGKKHFIKHTVGYFKWRCNMNNSPKPIFAWSEW